MVFPAHLEPIPPESSVKQTARRTPDLSGQILQHPERDTADKKDDKTMALTHGQIGYGGRRDAGTADNLPTKEVNTHS
jgi:hypothetical protein